MQHLEDESTESATVSVIIPVYNQPELLRRALDSLQEQNFSGFEAIVIDDGSDTDFGSIVEEYGDWANLIIHDKNQGASQARNTGIRAASGEYIAFLDADDVWKTTKLKQQYEKFESSNQDVGLIYTGYVEYMVNGTKNVYFPEKSGDIYLAELERDHIHPTSTVMIRRECIEKVGGFDPELPSRQDYDLWIRITEEYRVDLVDEILVEKHEQPDSISKNFKSRIEGDLAVFNKIQERTKDLDLITRNRILSHHHHVLGWDHQLDNNRAQSLKHFVKSVLRYPFHLKSWIMIVLLLFGIDPDSRMVTSLKELMD